MKWFDRLTIPREVEGRHKMHKRDKKTAKKVLYKHINSAVLQAAEDKIVFGGKCGFGFVE